MNLKYFLLIIKKEIELLFTSLGNIKSFLFILKTLKNLIVKKLVKK